MYYLIDNQGFPYLRTRISNWRYFWASKEVRALYCKHRDLSTRKLEIRRLRQQAIDTAFDKRVRAYRQAITSNNKPNNKTHTNQSYFPSSVEDSSSPYIPPVDLGVYAQISSNNHSHDSHVEFGGGSGGGGGATGSWEPSSHSSSHHSSYDSSSHHSSYDSGSSDSGGCDSGGGDGGCSGGD